MDLKELMLSRRTGREALFLLSGLPLGTIWFTVLVTGWSVSLGLAVTPLVLPMAMALGAIIRGCASAEAAIAREALDLRVYPPHRPLAQQGIFRRAFGWLADPAMWKAQGYLAYRASVGFGLGTGLVALLGSSLFLIGSPLYYNHIDGGFDLGFMRVDTLGEAFLMVPVGIALLIVTILLVRPFGQLSRYVAGSLLERSPDPFVEAAGPVESIVHRRRDIAHKAVMFGIATVVLTIIWALTGHGYFWPVWPAISFLLWLGVNGSRLYVDENPELWQRPGMTPALAAQIGTSASVVLFLIVVWAITGHGYFWPVWPLLGVTVAAVVRSAILFLSPPDQEELTRRIETLTTTRAGAVDQQEAELRRIERDLHDGAQARLVALGMSIGMAEQKLATDPEGAKRMLEEARVGAGQALKELRDLARGIHPPVLADRGLEAAITALADASPLRVNVRADVAERPAAPVESAAYFLVAEALANATKHSQAGRVDIRIFREDDILTVEIADDGRGGADPSGAGLSGLRRRVEALDGKLRVASPVGGPTVVRAEIPCG